MACFTAFDYMVGNLTGMGNPDRVVGSLVVTFLIGAPFGIFVMGIMTAQRRLQSKLRYLSETDSLTELHNLISFLDKADAALKENPCAAIMMVDVDHFKVVNDTYGHYTGDVTLKQIARHISDRVRDADIAGRIGGEEFAILLSGLDEKGVAKIADDICQKIRIHSPRGIGEKIPSFDVTVSVGGVFALPGYRLVDLMSKADEAMYGAKASGRNCVVLRQVTELAA